jgi:hypothetical protein
MKLIAHRGNIIGPETNKENSPDHIMNAISQGYDVEVDLWSKDTALFLGHDEPQYEIEKDFLEAIKDNLWVHCKNLEALYFCEEFMSDINYFWHQKDDFTLTSKRFIWTYPGQHLSPRSIVMPEIYNFEDVGPNVYGICSDDVEAVKEILDAI